MRPTERVGQMPFPHAGDGLVQVARGHPFYGWVASVRRLAGESMQPCLAGTARWPEAWRTSGRPVALAAIIVNQERKIIETALEESRGRISGPSGAAGKLGIPRTTFESTIKTLRINKHQFEFAYKERLGGHNNMFYQIPRDVKTRPATVMGRGELKDFAYPYPSQVTLVP
jgi:hypothetical protein